MCLWIRRPLTTIWTSAGGLSLQSSNRASQTVSHALTGRYSKFVTSYAHAYLTYLSHTSCTHRIHQPIPFLSPWACALGLLMAYALESRVSWAPARRERTNEQTSLDDNMICTSSFLADVTFGHNCQVKVTLTGRIHSDSQVGRKGGQTLTSTTLFVLIAVQVSYSLSFVQIKKPAAQ